MEDEIERLKISGSEAELEKAEKEYNDKIKAVFRGSMTGVEVLKNETAAFEKKLIDLLTDDADPIEIERITKLLNDRIEKLEKINVEILDSEELIKNTMEQITKINDNIDKLEIDKTSETLNKIFKTSNIDELEQIKFAILKNMGDIGKLTDIYFKKKNKLLEDILVDKSIFTVKQTKVDTESILDFDKLIQKIIFNFDEINKDLQDITPLISTINKSTFDKLITSSKSLKIQMDKLYFILFNTDGTPKITSLKTATKMRFQDILENIKSIFDKMDILEQTIISLYNVYNPSRTQPEAARGGGRNEYIFNDLLNNLPSRFH